MTNSTANEPLSDEAELVRRAQNNEEAAFRAIMRLHNSRLFRVARGILREDAEAEDVLQEAYIKAFKSLGGFRGESSLSTWLTRIVMNEALQRLRRRVEPPTGEYERALDHTGNVIAFPLQGNPPLDPERIVAQRQIVDLIEQAIDSLPDDFRAVLVARVLEDMSIEETAELLSIRPETVKTRLFRARQLLKAAIAEHAEPLLNSAFPFAGRRCERLTNAVIERLKKET
jgi:RNA polymerase sigma-70 factor, ECF subfamily